MTAPGSVFTTGRAQALLIGCGEYDEGHWPPVKAAKPMLRRLRSALHERCGMPHESITEIHDPEDPQELLVAVDQSARRAAGGTLFLYFVGHAAPDGAGRLRLMTRHSDSPYALDTLARYSQASFRDVVKTVMSGAKADRPNAFVAILDCCAADRGASDMAQFDSEYFLLAAATKDERALAPLGQQQTSFGGRVLDLLEQGIPEFGPVIRLDHFADVLRKTTPPGVPIPKASGPAGHLVLAPNPHPGALEHESRPTGNIAVPSGKCPYPGLAAFTEAEQAWFRGREDYADEIVFHLTATDAPRLPLLLGGPSGTGKTSFLRAALLPRLAGQPAEDMADLRVTTVFEPETPTPLKDFAQHIAGLADITEREEMAQRLRNGQAGAASVARQVMTAHRSPDRPLPELLLVVDQFERVYAAGTDPTERAAFIDALCTLAETDVPAPRRSSIDSRNDAIRVRVLLTIASEFDSALMESDDRLRRALTMTQHILPALDDSDVRRAVVEPAVMEGLIPDDDFVAQICADFRAAAHSPYGDAPGERQPLLPHLAQALYRTWHQTGGRCLTLRAYEDSGSLAGSIEGTAEKCFQQLSGPAQDIARTLVLDLVDHEEQQPYGLRTVPEDILIRNAAQAVNPPDPELARQTLAAVRQHRLVVDRPSGICLVHLALIGSWPRLARWLREDQEWHIIRQRIQAEAQKKHGNAGRRDFSSHRFLPDDFAQATQRKGRSGLTAQDWGYLDAAMEWWNQQSRRRRRSKLLHFVTLVTAVVAVLACVGALVYGLHENDAAQRHSAERNSVALAAAAASARASYPDLAARLAVAAYQSSPTPQAWAALLTSSAQILPTSASSAVYSRLSGTRIGVGDQQIATATPTGEIALDAVANGKQIAVLPDSQGFTADLTFAHGARFLAAVNQQGVLRLWDTASPSSHPRPLAPTDLGSLDRGTSYTITFSEDGSLLTIAADNSAVGNNGSLNGSEVWRVPAVGTPTRLLRLAGSFARFTGQGSTLAVRDRQGHWTLQPPDSSGSLPSENTPLPVRRGAPASSVCFGRHGSVFAETGDRTRLWALTGRNARSVDDLGVQGTSCALADDGGMLAIYGSTTQIWSLDAHSRASLATVIETSSTGGQFSPADRLMGDYSTPPRLWDLSSLRQPGLLAELPDSAGRPGPTALDSSGTYAAVAGDSGTVSVWDLRQPHTPKPYATIAAPLRGGTVSSLGFTPGTERLAVAYTNAVTRAWDVARRPPAPAPNPPAPADPRLPSATYPHGATTATSDGGTVTLTSGPEDHPVKASATPDPGAVVTAMALDANATMLAVGDERGSLTLVKLKAHTVPVASVTFPMRTAAITGIAIGPSGILLVSSADGMTRLSSVSPAALVRQVCSTPLTPHVAAEWRHFANGSARAACKDN
ncbi:MULTISPECIES: nSTAND1 domain-containing NTPase [unclassified Streptomyces]|uniref:nSTAND1 domain-containing NTPase n=1 Tax=unclassified Streptomyces TaxID=2593676 RepID=UPI00404186BC